MSRPEKPLFVNSQKELAAALGNSRMTVYRWMNRPDLKPDLPELRDGMYDVEAWRAFKIEKRLARADEDVRGEVPEGSVIDWKRKREELQCVTLERRIAADDAGLLVTTELELVLGQAVNGILAILSDMPRTVAPSMVGIRDVHEAMGRLENASNTVLEGLNAAEYLADCIDEEVEDVETSSEEDRIIGLLAARGVSREELNGFLAQTVRNVFSGIGRRTLAQIRSDSVPFALSVDVSVDTSEKR